MFVHFLKNCPEKWVNNVDLSHMQLKLVLMSWRYVVINNCIVSLPPYIEMVPLGVYRLTHALGKGVWGRGLGNFHVWLTQYVPLCTVGVYGIFNLRKKYSISLFSILTRVAIWIHFAINRVRIKGF